jgi:hypothetical protein
MAVVHVMKRFTLQLNPVQIGESPDENGKLVKVFAEARKIEYLPGHYDITDEEILSHWYFQAHLEGYQEPPPPDGTPQYAAQMLKVEQAVRMGESVADQGQKPEQTPQPEGIERAVPVHYFAGRPIPDENSPAWMRSASQG